MHVCISMLNIQGTKVHTEKYAYSFEIRLKFQFHSGRHFFPRIQRAVCSFFRVPSLVYSIACSLCPSRLSYSLSFSLPLFLSLLFSIFFLTVFSFPHFFLSSFCPFLSLSFSPSLPSTHVRPTHYPIWKHNICNNVFFRINDE